MYYELNYHNDFTQFKRIIQEILEKNSYALIHVSMSILNSDGVDLHDFFFVDFSKMTCNSLV